jgi:sterol 3beta-glucosyltransferase
MIANYGYEDGSGFYYITIDGDLCARCANHPCVTACPQNVYAIESAPFDWLLPRMAAVVHHGGAGTTGAGLAAGRPSVVVPFFADQHFWGWRVSVLGAGPRPIPRRQLSADRLAAAIAEATSSPAIQARAAALGEQIRAEDGVGMVVRLLEG